MKSQLSYCIRFMGRMFCSFIRAVLIAIVVVDVSGSIDDPCLDTIRVRNDGKQNHGQSLCRQGQTIFYFIKFVYLCSYAGNQLLEFECQEIALALCVLSIITSKQTNRKNMSNQFSLFISIVGKLCQLCHMIKHYLKYSLLNETL